MKEKIILKRALIITLLAVSVFGLIYLARRISVYDDSENLVTVEEGVFQITISSTGDLFAERSIDLKGPTIPTSGLRRGRGRSRGIRARNIEIVDIVPEGTMVEKGDYVAELDRTDYENSLKDELERLNTLQEELTMKVHDTAITLTRLRNEIKNQGIAVEEAEITLEQSKYEPPATIRMAEIDLDKQKRSLEQKKKKYNLIAEQEEREIENMRYDIAGQQRLVEDLKEYLSGFTIRSPAHGMVIYKRNWNGTQRKAGSSINPFDMVVATLPDLTSMVSKTYISEIDIRKVKPGLDVNIEVDALPDVKFTGTVASIARIGEKLPNSDTKMFEVLIRLDQNHPDLRPSMTTSNEILVKTYDNVVHVPMESVYPDPDGFTYVYTKDKTRQVVLPGESNGKDIIIGQGLEPGTEIYLSRPENYKKFELSGENLISDVDRSHDEGASGDQS